MSEPQSPKLPELPSEAGPSWKRIGDFLRNVLKLERSVESLRTENKELREQLKTMQRQLDDQSGRLLVLTEFVSKAMDDRIATRAEDAAIRAIERYGALMKGRKD